MIAYQSLKDIAKEIEATGKPKRIRVRRLLSLVGQERRGKQVRYALRRLLRRHRLKCDPDFANVHIDAPVRLTLGPKLGRPPRTSIENDQEIVEPVILDAVELPDEAEEEIESESLEIEVPPELKGATDAEDDDAEEETPEAESDEREVIITIRQGIPAGGRPPVLAILRPGNTCGAKARTRSGLHEPQLCRSK